MLYFKQTEEETVGLAHSEPVKTVPPFFYSCNCDLDFLESRTKSGSNWTPKNWNQIDQIQSWHYQRFTPSLNLNVSFILLAITIVLPNPLKLCSSEKTIWLNQRFKYHKLRFVRKLSFFGCNNPKYNWNVPLEGTRLAYKNMSSLLVHTMHQHIHYYLVSPKLLEALLQTQQQFLYLLQPLHFLSYSNIVEHCNKEIASIWIRSFLHLNTLNGHKKNPISLLLPLWKWLP